MSVAPNSGAAAPPSRAWLAALVLLPFALLNLVGLDHPGVVDYDEAVYAAVSKQMAASGDWIDPEYNGEPFHEKPPFLYWVQALAYRVLGTGPAAVRVGPALAALALQLMIVRFAWRPLGGRTALFAAAVLGVAPLHVALARVALVDGLLSAWFALCLFLLHRAFESDREGRGGLAAFLGACAASGMAMLTKGLIGIVLPVAAALLWAASLGQLRRLLRPAWLIPGALVMLGIGFSWYLLLAASRPDGFAFAQELFVEHHFQRFTAAKEGHSGQPWYFVPVLLFGLLPFCPLLLPAIDRARLRDGATPGGRLLRLFGLFAAITFLFFSASATKLPNYVAPVLPGAALWIGAACAGPRQALFETRRARSAWWLASALLLATALAIGAGAWVAGDPPPSLVEASSDLPLGGGIELGAGPWLAAALLAAAAIALRAAVARRLALHAVVLLSAAQLAASAALGAAALPAFERTLQRPLIDAARVALRAMPAGEPLVLYRLRRRASLPFELDCRLEHWGGGFAREAGRFAQPGRRHGIATRRDFERGLAGLGAVEIGSAGGYVAFRLAWEDPPPAAAADALAPPPDPGDE